MAVTFTLKDVGFTYPRATDPVLRKLTLCFNAGERIAVLGPSGVGKSTLISVLGLLTGTKQFTGNVEYVDSKKTPHTFQGLSSTVAEQLRRTEFGFALQSSYLLPHLTVIENLEIPLGLNGVPPAERRARAMEFLSKTGDLKEKANIVPTELSGGQRQRVAVLRSIINDPVVLFADEPFSALPEESRDQILQVLSEWQSEKLPGQRRIAHRTLFLVCHDELVAQRHCERVLRMGPACRVSYEPIAHEGQRSDEHGISATLS